jgi:outer membrane immunogenic protein
MRRFHCAALAAVAVIGFASVASAADMPVKAPAYKAPAAVPVPTWTGFYVGGHVGGAFGTSDWNDYTNGVTDANVKPSGFIGGGQIGYNYQINRLVLGIEADGSWSSLSDTMSGCFQNNPPQSCMTKADWFATLTGRVGFTWDRALFYAKGGAAWGHFKYENPCPAPCYSATTDWFASETRSGWTVGGGIEYMLNNMWYVKLEYDYLDFGTSSPFFVGNDGNNNFLENITNRVQMVKVGANYRFGWPQ